MHRSEHDPDLHAIALEAMTRNLVDQWVADPHRAGEAGMCLSDDEYDAIAAAYCGGDPLAQFHHGDHFRPSQFEGLAAETAGITQRQRHGVGHIIDAMEGPLNLSECATEGECECPRSEGCKTRRVWEYLTDSINRLLYSITLQDMLESKEMNES